MDGSREDKDMQALPSENIPGDPKTYCFRGSTLQLKGHNLLFCRAWGHRLGLL